MSSCQTWRSRRQAQAHAGGAAEGLASLKHASLPTPYPVASSRLEKASGIGHRTMLAHSESGRKPRIFAPVRESIDYTVFLLMCEKCAAHRLRDVVAQSRAALRTPTCAVNTGILNIQTKRLRNHDVDEDEAVVCRGLVETPFDIVTSGFT